MLTAVRREGKRGGREVQRATEVPDKVWFTWNLQEAARSSAGPEADPVRKSNIFFKKKGGNIPQMPLVPTIFLKSHVIFFRLVFRFFFFPPSKLWKTSHYLTLLALCSTEKYHFSDRSE